MGRLVFRISRHFLRKILSLFGINLYRLYYFLKTEKEDIHIPEYISVTEVPKIGADDRIPSKGISVLEKSLGEIINKERFLGSRILEIGPKHGIHSKWIDSNLKPSKLVMIELPQKEVYCREWLSELTHPHEIIYESLLSSKRLMNMEQFDLIFCAGVLYHTIEHFKVLNILRRLLKDDGLMLFQTSIDLKHKEPVILLNWNKPDQTGSYAYPSKIALLKMFAMTGWTNLKIYVDYRPLSNTILLTCQKSKDLFASYDKLPFGGSTV